MYLYVLTEFPGACSAWQETQFNVTYIGAGAYGEWDHEISLANTLE